jgi:hypothetical protein
MNLKILKITLNERLCFGGLPLLKKNFLLSNVIAGSLSQKIFRDKKKGTVINDVPACAD